MCNAFSNTQLHSRPDTKGGKLWTDLSAAVSSLVLAELLVMGFMSVALSVCFDRSD